VPQADRTDRKALVADMMHDAVRADVLRALRTDGAQHEAALNDLADHSSTLKDSLAKVAREDLPRQVHAAVVAVTPAVDD
jgi:hypothetical protein